MDDHSEFAKETHEEFKQMRTIFDRMEKLVKQNPDDNGQSEDLIQKMQRLLPFFRDRLLCHFDMEENHGIFDDIIKQKPESENAIARLCNEHKELKVILDNLWKKIEKNDQKTIEVWQDYQREFRQFSGLFKTHEQTETDFIQDIYYTDIGGHN